MQAQYIPMQPRSQTMNGVGVGEDISMDRSKTLMQTAMHNNSRKVSGRPGQTMPMPAQPNSAQLMAIQKQQQQQQTQQPQQTQPQQQQSLQQVSLTNIKLI